MLASLTAALLPQSPQYWYYRHMPPHPGSGSLRVSFAIALQTNSVLLLREWQRRNQSFFNITVQLDMPGRFGFLNTIVCIDPINMVYKNWVIYGVNNSQNLLEHY